MTKEENHSGWDWITVPGYTWDQVRERFREHLPKNAYKPVAHMDFLTDIKPDYLFEALNDVFGPMGIGWGIETPEIRVNDGGKRVEIYCDEAVFWYVAIIEGERKRVEIPTNGASTNSDRTYAVRGMRTSAINGAARMLEWQFDIRVGLHNPLETSARQPNRPYPVHDPQDPGAYTMPYGQRKGKTLADIAKAEDGIQYIKSLAAWDRTPPAVQAAAKAFLANVETSSSQSPPQNKPGLYVLQVGNQHKGETLIQIQKEDPGYLRRLADWENCPTDVAAQIKQFLPEDDRHWIESRGDEWHAWLADRKISPQEAKRALVGEDGDIRDFGGGLEDAQALVDGFGTPENEPEPEPEPDGDHWSVTKKDQWEKFLRSKNVKPQEATIVLVGEGKPISSFGGTMGKAMTAIHQFAEEHERI